MHCKMFVIYFCTSTYFTERGFNMKQTILSGIQPTGILTLGNYLGALRNWVKVQDEYDCMYFIADMHAITISKDPRTLRENTKKALMQYIACGLDIEKNTVFIQSHVPQHAELAWVLNCASYMGELSRMTQFKDKSKKQKNIGVGLFDYPVLMAADILLYDPDYVPVGEDQRQHLELARDIAKRFNGNYGKEIFKMPKGYVSETGARIMSLQNPTKKMSKSSDNPLSYISLLDDRDTIVAKLKKAKTDSLNEVKFNSEQPGISNLINIYASITGKSISDIEGMFEGQGYGKFKLAVAEVIADTLEHIQQRYYELDKPENEDFINEILRRGAKRASDIAEKKLTEVFETIGFYAK